MTTTLETTRREFNLVLGAGLLIGVASPLSAQDRGGRGGRGGGGRGGAGGAPRPLSTRLHIDKSGLVTVMTGKVECGQGARAQITQAAAEELRLPPGQVRLIMADTSLCPDDGITAGSRTTPSTIPAIRQACAAARGLLVSLAAKQWNADGKSLSVADGKVTRENQALAYADLANSEAGLAAFKGAMPADVSVTPVAEWKTLGQPLSRPNRSDLVTGGHHFPSDITRPGMLFGRVLRPPTYNARLTAIDLAPAKAIEHVIAINDNNFVAVAAANSFLAQKAVESLDSTARWDTPAHVGHAELFDHFRKTARGGMPKDPFAEDFAKAAKSLKATYTTAYVQHAPMEPRAAVAEWSADGKLTVWTATQNPFGVRGELARAFNLQPDNVRVIVPDFGGGFGGKHTGEYAVECARIAKAAGKPVSLRWTREEEFTFASFRPAALIDAEASLDDAGKIATWHFTNVNSGGSAVESPYNIAKKRSQFIAADAPLRHGSYRALASTANTFARESFMDELAKLAGKDPLEFRLAHLPNDRLRAVLEKAAAEFNWKAQAAGQAGVGLACGTEKNSFVAACASVEVKDKAIRVTRICMAYECGAIMNPAGLRAQVLGAIVMGLGPALREEIRFEAGRNTTASFGKYPVPRFADLPPQIDIHLIDRKDLPSVGAGETPIIAVAPAVANAVFRATGHRLRSMPMKLA